MKGFAQNWPAVAFAAALAGSALLATVSSGSGWCQADEAAVVCARNWFNAAGNVAAAVIAVVAVLLAAGQLAAAKQQAIAATSQSHVASLSLLHAKAKYIGQLVALYISCGGRAGSLLYGMNILARSPHDQSVLRAQIARFNHNLSGLEKDLAACEQLFEDMHQFTDLADFVLRLRNNIFRMKLIATRWSMNAVRQDTVGNSRNKEVDVLLYDPDVGAFSYTKEVERLQKIIDEMRQDGDEVEDIQTATMFLVKEFSHH